MMPDFTLSIRPARSSRSEQRAEDADIGEARRAGWWKLPTRFLPSGRLTPTLPPTLESTWARQRGGNLDIRNAAHEDGGDKAAEVANDAAAKGDEQRAAVAAGADHLAGETFDVDHGFVALAGGEKERARAARRKERRNVCAPERPDLGRGERRRRGGAGADGALDARGEGFEETAAGEDVVPGRGGIYADGLHGFMVAAGVRQGARVRECKRARERGSEGQRL